MPSFHREKRNIMIKSIFSAESGAESVKKDKVLDHTLVQDKKYFLKNFIAIFGYDVINGIVSS